MPKVGTVMGVNNATNVPDAQRLFNKLKGRLNELQRSIEVLDARIEFVEARKREQAEYNRKIEEVASPSGTMGSSGRGEDFNDGGFDNFIPSFDVSVNCSIINRRYGENRDGDSFTLSYAWVEDQDYSSIRYTNPLQLAFDYKYIRRYWLILTIGGVVSHQLYVDCWDYEDWAEDERGDDENVIVVSWHRTQRLIVHGQTVAYGTATNFNTGNDGLTPAARPPDVVGWTKEGDWGYDIEAITTGMLELYNRLDAFSSEEDKLIINSYFPLASEEEAPIVKVTDNNPNYEHTRTELGEDWVHVGTESGYPTEAKFRISGTAGNQVEAFDAVITWPTSDPDDDPNAVHSHTEAFFGSGTYSGSTGYIDVGTYPTKGKPSNSDLDCYSSNITIKGEE